MFENSDRIFHLENAEQDGETFLAVYTVLPEAASATPTLVTLDCHVSAVTTSSHQCCWTTFFPTVWRIVSLLRLTTSTSDVLRSYKLWICACSTTPSGVEVI